MFDSIYYFTCFIRMLTLNVFSMWLNKCKSEYVRIRLWEGCGTNDQEPVASPRVHYSAVTGLFSCLCGIFNRWFSKFLESHNIPDTHCSLLSLPLNRNQDKSPPRYLRGHSPQPCDWRLNLSGLKEWDCHSKYWCLYKSGMSSAVQQSKHSNILKKKCSNGASNAANNSKHICYLLSLRSAVNW